MSMFDAAIREIADAGQDFDRMNRKTELLREYTISDYKIECGNTELEYLNESVSIDDLFLAYEAEGKKVGEKLKKLVKANDKNAKEYFDKTEKSITKLEESGYKKVIDRAEGLFRSNPDLGKSKVEITDYDNELKAITDGKERMEKLSRKIKTRKKVTPADREELKKITDQTNKERDRSRTKKIVITAAAAVTLLSAGLVVAKQHASKKKTEDSGISQSLEGLSPEDASFLVGLHSQINRLAKEESAVVLRKLVAVKNSFKGFLLTQSPSPKIESTEESEEMDDVVVSEHALDPLTWDNDFDSAMILQDVVEQVREEELVNTMETNYEEMEESTTMSYLDELLLNDFEESYEMDDDERDIEDILNEAAMEAGLLDDEDDYLESGDEDDIEAILEEAAIEAGLGDDNSVDSLLENFEESMNL